MNVEGAWMYRHARPMCPLQCCLSAGWGTCPVWACGAVDSLASVVDGYMSP